jgi:NTE family protein
MATVEWTGQADGVFRGGGVKGLALAGALVGFAEHPTKPVTVWKGVAGASAGAIIASYLAFNRKPTVGKDMIALLDPERLVSFQDFPLGRKYLGGIPRLVFKHGMAPGNAFEKWFDGVLEGSTFAIASDDGNWAASRLKLIAADVTNRRLLVLPEDLPKYRLPGKKEPIDPAQFPISKAARMSMSIPFFFQAVELDLVVGPDGEPIPPRRSYIVDGGTLSNFPVWLFDSPNPTWPTFGFTLTGGTGVGGGVQKLRRFLPWSVRTGFDIFHTAQEAWDMRFQTHSTQVRTFAVSATVIDPDGKPFAVNTTDFKVSKAHQDALVENGRRAATEFLDNFKLEDYFNTLHARLGPVVPAGASAPAAPPTPEAAAAEQLETPAPPETVVVKS